MVQFSVCGIVYRELMIYYEQEYFKNKLQKLLNINNNLKKKSIFCVLRMSSWHCTQHENTDEYFIIIFFPRIYYYSIVRLFSALWSL